MLSPWQIFPQDVDLYFILTLSHLWWFGGWGWSLKSFFLVEVISCWGSKSVLSGFVFFFGDGALNIKN